MVDKRKISFTIITMIVGLMIAIQFQTVKQPIIRDTRDTWELRSDLKREQEIQSQIIQEIRKYDNMIQEYAIDQKKQRERLSERHLRN